MRRAGWESNVVIRERVEVPSGHIVMRSERIQAVLAHGRRHILQRGGWRLWRSGMKPGVGEGEVQVGRFTNILTPS